MIVVDFWLFVVVSFFAVGVVAYLFLIRHSNNNYRVILMEIDNLKKFIIMMNIKPVKNDEIIEYIMPEEKKVKISDEHKRSISEKKKEWWKKKKAQSEPSS